MYDYIFLPVVVRGIWSGAGVCIEGAKRLTNEDLEGMIGRGVADPCCPFLQYSWQDLRGLGGLPLLDETLVVELDMNVKAP
jgi:hypothetical protein